MVLKSHSYRLATSCCIVMIFSWRLGCRLFLFDLIVYVQENYAKIASCLLQRHNCKRRWLASDVITRRELHARISGRVSWSISLGFWRWITTFPSTDARRLLSCGRHHPRWQVLTQISAWRLEWLNVVLKVPIVYHCGRCLIVIRSFNAPDWCDFAFNNIFDIFQREGRTRLLGHEITNSSICLDTISGRWMGSPTKKPPYSLLLSSTMRFRLVSCLPRSVLVLFCIATRYR